LGWPNYFTPSVDAKARQGFFEQAGVEGQATMSFHVLSLVEGAEEAELNGGVLFGVVQVAAVSFGPGVAR
jgi:hypothetical protein